LLIFRLFEKIVTNDHPTKQIKGRFHWWNRPFELLASRALRSAKFCHIYFYV